MFTESFLLFKQNLWFVWYPIMCTISKYIQTNIYKKLIKIKPSSSGK